MADRLAFDTMAGVLPLPYRKGAERLTVNLAPADSTGATFSFDAYGFDEYRARYGHDPRAPRCIVFPLEDVTRLEISLALTFDAGVDQRILAGAVGSADTILTLDQSIPLGPLPADIQLGTEIVRVSIADGVTLTVERGRPGGVPAQPHPAGTSVRRRQRAPSPIELTVPAGLNAHQSLTLPDGALGPNARLLTLTADPTGDVSGVPAWGAAFLLGNMAKLAWAVGREKDAIRHTAHALARSHTTAGARGQALDLIGSDLAVPRFPPRPHAVDDDTVCLHHLTGTVAVGDDFVDAVTALRPPGHPAQNRGAESGADGRFGDGAAVGPLGGLTLAAAAEFDVGAGESVTVELFVRLSEDPAAFAALIAKAPHDPDGALGGAGWSLGIGPFRGLPSNARWALSDGAASLEVFADRSLRPGEWHHIAGTLDRAAGRAALFLDGTEVASVRLNALGSLANGRAVDIGAVDDGGGPVMTVSAVLDEIRISSVARTHFGSVTGEDDEAYRRRLAIFRRWWRPSPDGLAEALNRAGPVAGDPNPFIIDETDAPVGVASHAIRILADEVQAGRSIAFDGRFDTPAPDTTESDFGAWMLTEPAAPNLTLGIGNDRLMQVAVARRVEALARLTASEPRTLEVLAAYDPAADDAATGRRVAIRHLRLAPTRLAALAHEAGFDHVVADSTGVTVTQETAPRLDVLQETGGSDLVDMIAGDTTPFRPDPRATGARAHWSIISGAAGRAVIRAHPADTGIADEDAATQPRIALEALSAGIVALRGELERGGTVITAVKTLRIGLDSLPDDSEVDAEGRIASPGSLPEAPAVRRFDPRILHVWDPLPRFGDEPNFADDAFRRVLFPLRQHLERLLTALRDNGHVPSDLTVERGFDSAADDLAFAEGRAVEISHASLRPEALAAMAHNAGAPLVRHAGGTVTVFAEGAPLIGIEAVTLPGVPDDGRMTLAAPRDLRLSLPDDGAGRDIFWDISDSTAPPAAINARTRPEVTVTPLIPGRLGLRAVMALRTAGATQPFSFAVRLKPELEVLGAVIPKDVYDVAMNVLSHFGPIGVLIDTASLRERIAGLDSQTLSALPRYTFPDFKDR